MTPQDDYRMIVDFWRFFRRCQMTNDWGERNALAKRLADKYKNGRYVESLILAALEELDRRERENELHG